MSPPAPKACRADGWRVFSLRAAASRGLVALHDGSVQHRQDLLSEFAAVAFYRVSHSLFERRDMSGGGRMRVRPPRRAAFEQHPQPARDRRDQPIAERPALAAQIMRDAK